MSDIESLKKSICRFIGKISSSSKSAYTEVSLYTVIGEFNRMTTKDISKAIEELKIEKVIVSTTNGLLQFDKSRLE